VNVDLLGFGLEQVAGSGRNEHAALAAARPVWRERLSELRDVHLDGMHGCFRSLLAPEIVDQAVNRNGLAQMKEEVGEKRTRLGAAKPDDPASAANLERAEQPKLELRPARLSCPQEVVHLAEPLLRSSSAA
jgi:hypothetical protein